jgi:PIN domain nuclease of toxin-antitoxin system
LPRETNGGSPWEILKRTNGPGANEGAHGYPRAGLGTVQSRATGNGGSRRPRHFSFTATVANLWELILKAGKPGALLSDPLPWWEKYVVRAGIPALAIRTGHLRALASMADHHKDPFDRILVAQAISEGLTLVSKDPMLGLYHASVVWE